MTDPYRFVSRKGSPAVYFNDGHSIYWVQSERGVKRPDDDRLVLAIKGAFDEFWRLYQPKPLATKSKVKK
jgi:hypothetical protein